MEIKCFLNVFLILQNFIRFTELYYETRDCSFPERWEGFWFQSGVQNRILIKEQTFSTKGRCMSSDGDKFLIVDEKRTCYRCVVIHEKHINVIQYKETYCFNKQFSLSKMCTSISGDASLYSMFRENYVPILCPFYGSYTFTYNKGYGECRNPVSIIDSCSSKNRMLFNYQACHDVYGTEAIVEELECIATWKEGSLRYLIGKIYHSHAFTNEDRFRCFVYENKNFKLQSNTNDALRVAQSGDATCNGLFSASEGSKTLKLYQNSQVNEKCDFPFWLNSLVEWYSLDSVWKYNFYSENSSLIITNSSGTQIDLYCNQILEENNEEKYFLILTKYVMGCQNGYVCLSFKQRDKHVVESQIGNYGKLAEDACSIESFDRYTLPHITLVSLKLKMKKCSLNGKFSLNSLSNQESLLWSTSMASRLQPLHNKHSTRSSSALTLDLLNVDSRTKSLIKRTDNHRQKDNNCSNNEIANLIIGCNQNHIIEFFSSCSSNHLISSYSCHDQWHENGTFYIITTLQSRTVEKSQRFCFMYREKAKNVFLFSSSSLTCRQNFNGNEALIFNATKISNCNEINNSKNRKISSYINLYMLLLIVVMNFWNHR